MGGTPIVRRLAHRTGIVDAPADRKVHVEPTPLLGGVAIYAAVILALVLFGEQMAIAQLAGIIIGATLVSFLGLWDDRRPLRPAVKLVGQVGAVLVMVAAGVTISLTGNPWVDVSLTLVWMLVITNAMNFLDNMDGLASGVCAVAAGTFLILAVANEQQLVAPLAAAVLGASLGFLAYNFNPATVFMGDTGSLFLGFALGALAIKLRFPELPTTVSWLVPVYVLAVPLFDLSLVLVSRARRRVNPFTTGGTDHLSHRMVASGLSSREAALAIYLVGCAAGGVGILTSLAEPTASWIVAGAVAALCAWAIWRLEIADGGVRGLPARAGAQERGS